jgi:thiol-disulfide isomerase/thioredoxin
MMGTVEVRDGAVSRVTMDNGRRVVGKLALPEAIRRQNAWVPRECAMTLESAALAAPGEFNTWPEERRMAWVKEYEAAHGKTAKSGEEGKVAVPLNFDEEGGVWAEGVRPGMYEVSVAVYEKKTSVMEEEILEAKGDTYFRSGEALCHVVVPEGKGEVDLGTVTVKARDRVVAGKMAPLFEGRLMEGGTLKLKELRGKYVLLDFWATWCGPCVQVLPMVKQWEERYGKDGLVVVGMNLDADEGKAAAFVKEKGYGWREVMLGEWTEAAILGAYAPEGIPSLYLIGPDGVVMAARVGPEEMERKLVEAFKEK